MVTIKELRNKGKDLKPMVNIGKNGMTPGVSSQVKRILQVKKLIKVRFLRSFVDASEGKTSRMLAKDLADSINARIIEVVGMIVVLAKK
ncbi:YhbY family RNA-binding protein [archaeon]|jgi:RNA-binding protein YhbY|nr:YhbY family RNA-binding protein [archaeon]MBT6762287.1 YhbY family RNA-binding protein [archaeon]